jgi:hypothetical protein
MTLTTEIRAQAGTQSGGFLTGVAPTVALRGLEELTLRSAHDIEVYTDMTQGLAGGDTAVVKAISAAGSFKGWGSYEHIAYYLDNLLGQATPSGAGSYTRNYAAPITTPPTPRILSLVKGDATVGAYQMVGSLISDFTLRFEPSMPLEISGDLIGVNLVPDTLEALAFPVVSPVMGDHVTTIKMDGWGGTMGATTVPNCTVRFLELTIKPDRSVRNCFGSLAAQSYIEKAWDGDLKLSLEFNATTKTDVDAIVAGTLTQKQIEINLVKATQSLKVQFTGTVQDDLEIFSDDDGVVTAEITLKRTYHPTFANWLKVVSINTLATLP